MGENKVLLCPYRYLKDVVVKLEELEIQLSIQVAVKEPSGLNRQDGKRPDRLSLIPWQSGKPLQWDVTVANTLAGSYVDAAATGAGLVADQTADRKTAKYADLRAQYVFQSVSVEKPGSIQLFYIGLSERPRSQNLSYFR